MRVVVDANILAAALIRSHGWTAQQMTREEVEFVTPYTATAGLQDHIDTFAEKADLGIEEARERVQELVAALQIVGRVALQEVRQDPLVKRASEVDPDDAPYLAALVATDADLLWTRDAALLDAFPGLAVRVVPFPPGDGG